MTIPIYRRIRFRAQGSGFRAQGSGVRTTRPAHSCLPQHSQAHGMQVLIRTGDNILIVALDVDNNNGAFDCIVTKVVKEATHCITVSTEYRLRGSDDPYMPDEAHSKLRADTFWEDQDELIQRGPIGSWCFYRRGEDGAV